MWHAGVMSTDPVRAIRTAVARRERNRQRDDEAVHDAIAKAVLAGADVKEVAEASGYHRNHVARIARERGVPDARTLKRRAPELES